MSGSESPLKSAMTQLLVHCDSVAPESSEASLNVRGLDESGLGEREGAAPRAEQKVSPSQDRETPAARNGASLRSG